MLVYRKQRNKFLVQKKTRKESFQRFTHFRIAARRAKTFNSVETLTENSFPTIYSVFLNTAFDFEQSFPRRICLTLP